MGKVENAKDTRLKTVVINVLGGSGLGKSSLAATLFGELKRRRKHCELVREYVKEQALKGIAVGPFGQNIIYGHQLERESGLYGIMDYVVTDSPLMLCPIYQSHYNGHDTIKHSVFADLKTAKELGVVHLNFLIRRDPNRPFDTRGRYEDEQTAKLIDKKVEAFLLYHGIDFIVVDTPEDDRVKFIADQAIAIYEKLSQGDSDVRKTV